MPQVEVLTEVSGPDPEAVVIEYALSEMLANEHDADQPVERIGWTLVDAEQQITEIHAHASGSAAAAPARSVRRATARRASNRRAIARSRQRDIEASVIEFLAQHAGSTAGDVAKGLNLNTGRISNCLTQLAKAGEIKRASHGYSANDPAGARTYQHPLRRSH